MKKLLSAVAAAVVFSAARGAYAGAKVRFIVIDPKTGKQVTDVQIQIQDPSGAHKAFALIKSGDSFDAETWKPIQTTSAIKTVVLTLGKASTVQAQQDQVPTKDIYIKVTATRIRHVAQGVSGGTERTQQQIKQFNTGPASGGANGLVQNQAGVASDSAGQQHVRGEHAEIAYVVDGVPLPDTLSGRQGSIVVESTVSSLDLLEGAYAPEFGGQTAAILNITTLPGSKTFQEDVNLSGVTYNTYDGDLTAVGPLGKKANFTFDLQGNHTGVYQEPQQPGNDTAHNAGEYYSVFGKLRFEPSKKDVLSLTVSHNPDTYQDSNRTGQPDSFADVGEGFGFLGVRNADGSIPAPINPGGYGSQILKLPTQQQEGMDINSSEENEFAVLQWRHQFDSHTSSLFSLTSLHSGDSVTNDNPTNGNPTYALTNLYADHPDDSIEYSPTVTRNAHHFQGTGNVTSHLGSHELKAGFLLDRETGNESYNVTPDSQLALDELAALDPLLAPSGTIQMSNKKPVLDVNGNPVFLATSNASPTVNIHREGWYDAAYAQDTWKMSKRFIVNYGLRYDFYSQNLNIQTTPVNKGLLEPRINFSYDVDKRDVLRWSYNKLFNTPPLAEGAIVGAPIVPEVLDQYDVSLDHDLGKGQDIKVAYYAKQIKDQVDTGLLVPGSEIGLFSAVNFDEGAVHGMEVTYDLYAPHGIGWDGFVNYSYSVAAPNGLDNTGAEVPDYNDHDQRNTVGAGLSYTFKNKSNLAAVFSYGSGLASSVVRDGLRTPRTETDLKYESSPTLFGGRGGFGVDLDNVFNAQTVINFQSGFSGTRFMEGRRVTFSLFAHF
jgi:outer membrane receptor protein involved in Fe transport